MLVCFGLYGLLLYNTVVANAVCSFTYSQKDEITALSQLYEQNGCKGCEYNIHAPRNNFIELNFTRIFGFLSQSSMTAGNSKSEETQNNDNSDACLPPELVLNEQGTDHYEQKRNLIWKICKTSHSLRLPQVFHSKLNVVKISFTWVENHSSGFTLEFDFHHFNSSCAHICDDQKCLFNNQVCNGQTDCLDKSDEQKCHTEFQSTGASQSVSDVQLIQPLVILLSLVLMPGLLLLLCVVSPCPLASRMWPRRRQSNRERTLEHSHLQPERKSSEVVYVPTPSPSRELLLQHQISQTQQPWGFPARATPCYQGNMLDLPPQIPISKDGEEGYIESQKQLIKNKRKFINDQLVRPPPNKTVHDRESPPPYCSKTTSLENVGNPGNTRIVRDMDGCPRVQRCFSMSVNERTTPTSANGHKDTSKYGQKPTVANTNNRTLSTNLRTEDCPVRTVRHSFTPNIQSDRPPDYEVFCSSDNNNQRSLHVDSV
ncbi:uncharacterized protein LOC127844276 isoform X2 [Dreissena polymorpha]|uniref:uncharacterized protein LOC127844276 isoform X2 n=1 Tax=Dreissena polymorpha TaxID=45954 RepID=UPI0022655BEB|nr:uncharacterized protein LOC127844276 isoform X2 [Dreissena polymorpha]